ncbi:nucleoporin SEH1-like [Styela clava]|uniref:nucleoporin SEH1-like n=1 Tax=Styela clava TaxID=7725 RepID=UPI00193AB133|nr:nucleoporin SEH1-like [Styela clava]
MDDTESLAEFSAIKINAEHKDLIHDLAFDHYGKRMATCSSDQTVKVWDLDDDGDWYCSSSWKTHNGSVWKVCWAHPEFGQVLATCSFDRTAAVWEEIVTDTTTLKNNRSWIRKSSLVDSRTSVTDVKFAPKHLGLQLATCSADGIVRVYEAPDVMNLAQWSVQHQIKLKLGCSCLSWNPSSFYKHPSMIAVGSDDNNPSVGGKVLIYEYSEINRDWVKVHTIMTITDPVNDIEFAPNYGAMRHTLAVASKCVHIFVMKLLSDSKTSGTESSSYSVSEVAKFDAHNSKVWRVSWNVLGTVLSSSGDDGKVHLWKANYLDNWRKVGTLKNLQDNKTTQSNVSRQNSSNDKGLSNSQQTIRSGFMRFVPGREPPSPRPIDPRFENAYY